MSRFHSEGALAASKKFSVWIGDFSKLLPNRFFTPTTHVSFSHFRIYRLR